MTKPILAIVGRPNVGKSTLFNRLTRSRDALVADYPGLTRDRQYGTGRTGKHPYIIVDTGGLSGDQDGVEPLMAGQVQLAIEEADAVLFLVDGRTGLLPADEIIAGYIRRFDKPTYLLVNKSEGRDAQIISADFFQMGLGKPYVISSAHGDNVNYTVDSIIADIDMEETADESFDLDDNPGIRVAIIGRPNVGKSTLINRMLGEDRMVAFDLPGTTRDSIFVPFEKNGQEYTLIDTAGVRRRKNIKEKIEKFSIVKAIGAMESCNVVILVIDGTEGITDQDLTLLGLALESGRGLVIAINKWDSISEDKRKQIKHELEYKLQFVEYATKHLISALHGSGVNELFKTVKAVYSAAMKKVSTSELNRVLEQSILDHQPPLVSGRRIKLRYAHLGGINPPRLIIHGNQVDKLPKSYTSYLKNVFRKAFKWVGTPVFIEYKASKNPYENKKSNFKHRRGQSESQAENAFLKRKGKKNKQAKRRSN